MKVNTFKVNEDVPVWLGRVGPFQYAGTGYNQFYNPPYCPPKDASAMYKKLSLWESLFDVGPRMASTPYELKFKVDRSNETVCTKQLSSWDVARFRRAVKNNWDIQIHLDDLPQTFFIGKVEQLYRTQLHPKEEAYKYLIFTDLLFDIKYSGDQIVEFNLYTDPQRVADVSEGVENIEITFTYSIIWTPTSISYEDRWVRYRRPGSPLPKPPAKACSPYSNMFSYGEPSLFGTP